MSYHDYDDDELFGKPRHLSPSRLGPRRSPSRQSINGRRSSATLRPSALSQQLAEDDAPNGMHSLAHELAVALMPEPSAGQKMLAEEFGIEYDEGAEGIDGDAAVITVNGHNMANELDSKSFATEDGATPMFSLDPPMDDFNSQYTSEPASPVHEFHESSQPQDPMEVLSRDLEATDKFIEHLRRLDADVHGGVSSSTPTLEKIAADMIRRINDTARDREGQFRELVECEREFRKISGEVGGEDVLSRLDALEEIEGLSESISPQLSPKIVHNSAAERRNSRQLHRRNTSEDWEMNPDEHRLGDDLDGYSDLDSPTPMKDSFTQPPSINGPPTATTAIPQLVDMRSLTSSVVASLSTISEHAQVNGAANADAGRKIRALKNKLGNWKNEWDSAEKSRIRIERWEAGLTDDGTEVLPQTISSKRPDGRILVQQHLKAFELALADAGRKTQAIMSAS